MTNASAQNKVTNSLNYKLNVNVEVHSDILVSVLNPTGQESEFLNRNVDSTSFLKNISLGEQVDERVNCIKDINFRRTGICEDGNYQISINSTDSAGNVSETKLFKIERDTVKPAKPKGNLELCGTSICLKLSESEVGVLLVVNNKTLTNIRNSSGSYSILNSFNYDSRYDFQIKFKDAAGNESDTLTLSIQTPNLGIGGADPDYEDPYLGFNMLHYLNQYNNWSQIRINSDGSTNLESLKLSAPFISSVVNNFGTEDIDVYGFALPKNFSVPFKTKIIKEGISYIQAAEACNVSMPTPQWSKDCLAEKMNYEISEFTFQEARIINECGNTSNCFANWNRLDESFESISIKLTNVELFLLSNGGNITSSRTCDIGQPCYDNLKRYWHDNLEGKWRINFSNDKLGAGDQLSAFIKTYGSTSFSFENKSYSLELGNSGWQSETSNIRIVPEKLSLSDLAADPLDDPSCVGIIRSSDYGLRDIGDGWEFHEGVDFSGNTECKITSIYKGSATSTWYAGNTVKVKHSDEFTTLYGHNDQYLGEYPRSVDTDEYIMSMGCSGRCTGTHLHLELYQNEIVINPRDYLNHIISIYED